MATGSNTMPKPCQMGLWPNNPNFHRMPTYQFFLAIKNTFRCTATSTLALAAYRENACEKKHPLSALRRPNDGLNDRHQHQILLGNWAGFL